MLPQKSVRAMSGPGTDVSMQPFRKVPRMSLGPLLSASPKALKESLGPAPRAAAPRAASHLQVLDVPRMKQSREQVSTGLGPRSLVEVVRFSGIHAP